MSETESASDDSPSDEEPTRVLKRVKTTIEEVCDTLGLSEQEKQTAVTYLMASWQDTDSERKGGLLAGRGADNVAAACVILSAEKHGRPLHIDEVVNVWEDVYPRVGESFSKLKVGRAKRAVRKLDAVDAGDMMTVVDYIEEYGDRIDAPDELIEAAKSMYDDLSEDGAQIVFSGTPQGIAASILYFTARLNGLRLVYTQEFIEQHTKPTAVTIRNRYSDIREWFGEQMGIDPTHHKGIERELREQERYQIPSDVVEEIKSQRGSMTAQ